MSSGSGGKPSFLVLTEIFLPTRGGTAVWFAEVYARLQAVADTQVITAAVAGDAAVDAQHPARIHRLPLARVNWLRPESLLIYWRMFCCAWRLTRGTRYTAIHAGRALPEGLVALVVGRLRGLPVVIYAHGEELTSWGSGLKAAVMRRVLRAADHVIANSDYTRDMLLGMGVAAGRLVLIYPGVDCTYFTPQPAEPALRARLGLTPGQPIILSVGRLQRRKGFLVVLEALTTLLAQGFDAHYVIIGQGELKEELLASAAARGVSSRVHLLEAVETDELVHWYNACSVFAMPNAEIGGDTEGFGIVYLEAAACGKPAVAGMAGGTGSAVIDGETGLRVDGTNAVAVATALGRLLADHELARRLGERALARVRAGFDWSRVVAQTLAVADTREDQR